MDETIIGEKYFRLCQNFIQDKIADSAELAWFTTETREKLVQIYYSLAPKNAQQSYKFAIDICILNVFGLPFIIASSLLFSTIFVQWLYENKKESKIYKVAEIIGMWGVPVVLVMGIIMNSMATLQ